MILEGTITSWSTTDEVGRVRLLDGEEVRFGISACHGFLPAIGLSVHALEVSPHPLGGRRAVRLALTDPTQDDATNDTHFPFPGINATAETFAEFVSLTD